MPSFKLSARGLSNRLKHIPALQRTLGVRWERHRVGDVTRVLQPQGRRATRAEEDYDPPDYIPEDSGSEVCPSSCVAATALTNRAHTTERSGAEQEGEEDAGPVAQCASQSDEQAEDARWQKHRGARTAELLATLPRRRQQQQQTAAEPLKQSLLASLLQQADTACRCCHAAGSRLEGQAKKVTVLGLTHAAVLELPVYRCERCQARCSELPRDQPCCQVDYTPSPLQASCWPGTAEEAWEPVLTRGRGYPLWFTLDLLDAFRMLRRITPATLGCTSYSQYLWELYRSRGCGAQLKVDTMRKALQAASREYENALFAAERKAEAGLEAWRQPLAPCPACAQRGESTGALHSASVDFNFKCCHFGSSGNRQLDHPPPLNNKFFVPNTEVDHMGDNGLPPGCQPVVVAECSSDFRADRELGRRSSHYNVTALGVLTCRHGMVLRAMNAFTGERHVYALVFAAWLATTVKLKVGFLWYDIGCRWKKSLRLWTGNQLEAAVRECLEDTDCLLPPFHEKAHSLLCQEKNRYLWAEGAGVPAGEPPEQFNAWVNKFAALTKYMTPRRRQGFLETVIGWYNDRKESLLAEVLLRDQLRTKGRLAGAERDSELLLGALRERGQQEEEVERQLAALLARMGSPPAGPPVEDEAAYARAQLVLYVERQPLRVVRLTALLYSKSAATLRAAKNLVDLSSYSALPETVAFQPFMAALVTEEARQLMRAAEDCIGRAEAAEQRFSQLTGNRADQAKLRRQKETERRKAREHLGKLQQWLVGLFASPDSLPMDVQSAQAAACSPGGWDVEAMLAGRFPWEPSPAQETAQPGGSPRPAALLRSLLEARQTAARCREQLLLLDSEKQAALEAWNSRTDQLREALQSGGARVAALEAQAAQLQAAPEAGTSTAAEPRPQPAAAVLLYECAILRGTLLLQAERLAAVRGLHEAADRAFRQPTLKLALKEVRREQFLPAQEAAGEGPEEGESAEAAALLDNEPGTEWAAEHGERGEEIDATGLETLLQSLEVGP